MKDQIVLFKSLFKGRTDVFAIRWEKNGKSGYWPAYDINWTEYSLHKMQGGSVEDFPGKQKIPLTDERLIQHLTGKEIIGIYPLLQDSTSWFIAADFDQSESGKRTWVEECRLFITECEKYQLPVYLERSRSGIGGHVWLFFDNPYSAAKSRKLFLTLLTNSGIISPFAKSSNFDRLFPNQDSHSGKGFGNLIALPLQKRAIEKGNTCFIDPKTLEPFPDKWAFLRTIQKVSSNKLDGLFNEIISPNNAIENAPALPISPDGKIHVTLTNQITIPRHQLTPQLISYLRENLNFLNVDYLIKQKSGKTTYNSEPYFRTMNEKDGFFFLPRGFIGTLIEYFEKQKIHYHFEDKRVKLETVQFKSTITLHEYQQNAVEATNKKAFGVIVAPPGKSGQIKQFEEFILIFDSRKFHIQASENSFPIDCLDLPTAIEQFLPDICWRLRVIKYNDETGELIAEIIDYHYDKNNIITNPDPSFYFPGIEKIKFKTIDTAGFLRSVILKKQAATKHTAIASIKSMENQPTENVVLKTMKVPFSRIKFLYSSVSFPLFIEELDRELIFEIENADIRPEFDAIREYFSKTLKKKLITAEISVRHTNNAILSATAKSDDINCINDSLIETVRFEFVKREFFKPKEGSFINKANTFDSLLGGYHSSAKDLFVSEQGLLNDILNVKKCKHYLHLKYFSSKHETSILKLRFVLQPFSFLFLLSGDRKYHVIWETLDSEEATYIWHTEKSRDALRIALDQIEEIITGIKKSGRQDYLKQDHPNFSRIWHDYSDSQKGFTTWKGALDERMV